jgi:maspardin
MLPIRRRPEFVNFRSGVAKNKASVDNKSWVYYDLGPKDVEPLILLHGTSGTAESFFYQVLSLGNQGYRVISAQWPDYWNVRDWVCGFHLFLKFLDVKKVHLFGQSLGGYLALHYVAAHSQMVKSLALCNAFSDTQPFQQSSTIVKMFRFAPEFALKKFLLDSFPEKTEDPEIIDFMVEQMETLTRSDVGSRLTLNCINCPVPDFCQNFSEDHISFIDTHDEVVLPDSMRQRLYARFKNVRIGQLKNAGDFPMLSSPSEINMHLVVHLRRNGLFMEVPHETKPVEEDAHELKADSGESSSVVSNQETPYEEVMTEQLESKEPEQASFHFPTGVDLDDALFQDKNREEQLLKDSQRNLAMLNDLGVAEVTADAEL